MTLSDVLAISLPIVGAAVAFSAYWLFHQTGNDDKHGVYSGLAIVGALVCIVFTANLFNRDWGNQPPELSREEICYLVPKACIEPEPFNLRQWFEENR